MNTVFSRKHFLALAASGALVAYPTWARADGAFVEDVAWSPDDTQLLFSKGDVRGPMHLYRIRSDGTALTRLTTGTSINMFGAWSPDGTRIAFRSNRDGANELYVMRPDGTDVRRLTFDGAPNSFPSWSRTGSIAFNSKRSGTWQIFDMVPGKTPTQITDNAWNNENPVYSPDGRLIAFESNRSGSDAIYVINADGSNEQLVSGKERFCIYPGWRTNGVLTFSSSASADKPADSIHAVSLDTGMLSTLPIKAGFFVRWDRNGRRAAIISGSYPQTNVYVCDLDGTNLVEIA